MTKESKERAQESNGQQTVQKRNEQRTHRKKTTDSGKEIYNETRIQQKEAKTT